MRRRAWVFVAAALIGMSSLTIPRSAAMAQQPSAQQLEDVVYLKDGSVIRGTIVEQRPGESVLIRTHDGNQFRYRMEQIEKLAKEAPASLAAVAMQNPKSVGGAVALSVLITGGGQAYNGQWGKAAGFVLLAVVSYVAMASALDSDACYYNDDCGSAGTWALVFVGNWIWCVVDAGVSAAKINAHAGRSASLFVRPSTNVGQRATRGIGGSAVRPSLPTQPGLQAGLRISW